MKGQLFVFSCECGADISRDDYELMSLSNGHSKDYQEWGFCCPICGKCYRVRLDIHFVECEPELEQGDIWNEIKHQLGKKYSYCWHDENTGGGTMVFYKNYLCTDDKYRMVGLNEESIALYDCTYEDMYTDSDMDMGEHTVTWVQTDYHTDGINVDIPFSDYFTDKQIEDIRIGQWMYISKYMAD